MRPEVIKASLKISHWPSVRVPCLGVLAKSRAKLRDETVLPSKCHRAVGKESGETNHIERYNNTLRQRCSRLVRKTLSFSKKLANHIGAIW